jgi:formylglycine-generating enzyme required for sulfatase activity
VRIGSYPEGASWAGALDVAGNVWEWVNDWYDSNYYANSPAENPPGPESGEIKVLRGGSWGNLPDQLRSSHRPSLLGDPADRTNYSGFRCVLPGG